MNILDSWIDPDEMSDLVSDLVSVESKPKQPEEGEQDAGAPAEGALLLEDESAFTDSPEEEQDTAVEDSAPPAETEDSPEAMRPPSPEPAPEPAEEPPAPEPEAPEPDRVVDGGGRSSGPVIIRARSSAYTELPASEPEVLEPEPEVIAEEKEESIQPEEAEEAAETAPSPEFADPGTRGEEPAEESPESAPADVPAHAPEPSPQAGSPSPFSAPGKAPGMVFEKASPPETTAPAEIPEIPDDLDSEGEPVSNEGVDFDTPHAYEASAFPGGGRGEENAVSTGNHAAMQASEALESAKFRADQGGLLKHPAAKPPVEAFTKPQPAAPEIPKPAEPIQEEAEAPFAFRSPFEKPEHVQPFPAPAATAPEADVPAGPAEPAAPAEPQTLRERLAAFARSAKELANGSDLIVADFHSYPLISTDEPPGSQATQRDTVTRVSSLIGLIAERIEAESEGAIQIFLKNGDWLCSLAAESAAGGVNVTMRVPNPLSAAVITQLRGELERALKGN